MLSRLAENRKFFFNTILRVHGKHGKSGTKIVLRRQRNFDKNFSIFFQIKKHP